jgi:hypothetical protein
LSGTKSAQEKVWVRYSTNNWASSNTVEANTNVSGNTWRATINLNSGDFVSYYAFTTLNLTSAPAESDADFYTINYNNNNGVNYTVQIGPLSGDYYIPQGSNAKGYSSLASAIQNLNENGASGTVRFLIDGNLNETGANLHINRNDLSATNNLVIKPAPGKTPTITITGCASSGPNANSGLTINATSYVTIDGSNTDGGTTRDLTIVMNDGTNGRHGIQIYGNADYITIKNLKVKYTAIQSGTTTGNGIFVNGQSSGVSDYVSIINCEIGENSSTLVGPFFGISFTGSSSASLYCSNGVIANNVVYGRIRGINLFWHNGPGDVMNIYGNEIGVVNSPDGVAIWGVLHQNYAGTLNFYNNVIRTMVQTTSGTQGIYGFGTLNGVAGAVVNIFNNFLGGDFSHTGSGTPASIDVISFQDAPAATCNVYYNTVILNNMTKTAGGSSGRMTCIRLAGTWTKNVKNNIFINKKTRYFNCILHCNGCILLERMDFDYNLILP